MKQVCPTLSILLLFSLIHFVCSISENFQERKGNLRKRRDLLFYGNDVALALCGCPGCNFGTCGLHIQDLILTDATLTEAQACYQTSQNLQGCQKCGCSTNSGQPPPQSKPQTFFCSRETCTPKVWNTIAGGYSCKDRIEYVMNVQGKTEADACRQVAFQEFPNECGACDPKPNVNTTTTNNGSTTIIATNPSSSGQGHNAAPAGYRSGSDDENSSAATPNSIIASPPQQTTTTTPRCGCQACTKDFLQSSNADGYTCEARIDYLLSHYRGKYPHEEDACRQVAHVEYPIVCGKCYCP